jgi:hypothetical protein
VLSKSELRKKSEYKEGALMKLVKHLLKILFIIFLVLAALIYMVDYLVENYEEIILRLIDMHR